MMMIISLKEGLVYISNVLSLTINMEHVFSGTIADNKLLFLGNVPQVAVEFKNSEDRANYLIR